MVGPQHPLRNVAYIQPQQLSDETLITYPVAIEQWRRHYNEVRPHSSLGYRTPNEFVQQGCSTVKQGAVVQK